MIHPTTCGNEPAGDIQIAIIGGGVIGCAVAWELSRGYRDIFLFEKNAGITRGENQSSRNSGVIHSGIYYDQETRPLKARLCVQGNRLLYAFCARQGVPALRTGKLIVATSSEEEDVLDFYWKRSRENRVPQVKRISGGAVSALEPNVKARSALLVPTAGIVEPTRLVYRLHVLSSKQGVQFLPGTEVVDIENRGDRIGLQLCYPDKKREWVRARAVINAGGVEADRLARRLNPRTPHVLDPVRGESYKFYGHKRPELRLAGMNVYPTPEEVITPNGRHFTVGIHLTPTFGDWSSPPRTGSTVTVGPKLVPARDRDGWEGTPVSAGVFAEQVRPFFPGVRAEDLIWHQAGLQARLKGHPDFVVQRDEACPHCIHLMGIDSPGLTSCLAIARHVKALIKSLGLD